MLLLDENIRDGALVGHLLQRILNRRSIIDLVELDDVVLCAGLGEEGFGGFAVGAVGFGEDRWK